MSKSDQDDRRWRWVKALRRNLANALMRPQTWRMIVTVGIWVARAIWAFYRVIHFMRE